MLATEKWDLKLIDSLPRVMWGGTGMCTAGKRSAPGAWHGCLPSGPTKSPQPTLLLPAG